MIASLHFWTFCVFLNNFFIKGGPEGESYGCIKVAKVPSKKLHFKTLRKKKKNHEHIYPLLFFVFWFFFWFFWEGRNNF
jgi:hypothetical protein